MFRVMYFLKIVVLPPTFAVLTLISRAHTPVHLIIPTVCVCIFVCKNYAILNTKLPPTFTHLLKDRKKKWFQIKTRNSFFKKDILNSRTGHGGLVTAFYKNLIVIIVIFYTEKLVSDLFHESKTNQYCKTGQTYVPEFGRRCTKFGFSRFKLGAYVFGSDCLSEQKIFKLPDFKIWWILLFLK